MVVWNLEVWNWKIGYDRNQIGRKIQSISISHLWILCSMDVENFSVVAI